MRVFVLGASDPEMEMIEKILSGAGENFRYAAKGLYRVLPGTAYQADPIEFPPGTEVIFVECSFAGQKPAILLDHHNPGDPGYGKPPSEFLPASSIGQVLSLLYTTKVRFRGGMWWYVEPVPMDIVLTAAGDHCPGAAYQGMCPGVDPIDLMRFRAENAAKHRKISVGQVLMEIEAATKEIEAAPRVWIGGEVADLRGKQVPSLPEASLRTGIPVLYEMPGNPRDPRTKIGILGAGEGTIAGSAPITEFMTVWAPAHGLKGIYGDPVRGFAGGYR